MKSFGFSVSRPSCVSFVLGALYAFVMSASCANAASLPPSAAPEYLQQRFNKPTPRPEIEKTIVNTPEAKPSVLKDPFQVFVLKGVAIEGSTVYPAGTFEPIFAEKTNQKLSYEDAASLVREITTRYRADGYVLSQALVSQVDLAKAKTSGILRVQVVEGFINNVVIQNENPEADKRHLIAGYAQKITAERPLNTKTLERYMLLINDLPGVTARGVLRPSPETFGAADLIVEVRNKPIEASVSTDNRGNKFLGPMQVQATVTENSLAGLGERTTARLINSSQLSELHYIDVQHEQQIGSEGTRVIAVAAFGRTRPGASLESSDFKGRSDTASVSLTHPFIRSRSENVSGRVMAEARNVENRALGVKLNNDRIRALRAGGSYDTSDKLDGVDFVDVQVSQGVSGLGATSDGAGRSRTVAAQDFTKTNVELSRLQNLPHGFSVLTTASGQYSADALLTSEQYAVGGNGFGQAYDSGEISGDKALAGKVEFRYGDAVNKKYMDSFQLYAFYDLASVYLNDTAIGAEDTFSLASIGTGVRMNFTKNLYGYLELDLPLTRNVASMGDKDPRLFFSLTARY